MTELTVIGGGLAGCEAAWQAARRDIKVNLFEMRPDTQTGAHQTGLLAELVCSNSLGSNLIDRASGLLKEELRRMGSLLMECADASALPAGGALAVDREVFSHRVTQRVTQHPNIQLIRREVQSIPDSPAVIASGPLTSTSLSRSIQSLTGLDTLFFFDAIAPLVLRDSIDMRIAFRASRYERGEMDEGDYINAPFSKEEYDRFIEALVTAERIELRKFEQILEEGVTAGSARYFEGCLPVEVLARRGERSLAFGPMRPVGLRDPRTGQRPYAVLQLRQDNLAGSLYNMVGFQTNLKFPEQRRVFRMIPGLANAEFARYGQMHRNTFILSPLVINSNLQVHNRPHLFFAGQITGVEGYVGNMATGLLAGMNAARFLKNEPLLTPPQTTMLGALVQYLTHAAPQDFQPMKANFGILPPLEEVFKGKRIRAEKYSRRSLNDLQQFIQG